MSDIWKQKCSFIQQSFSIQKGISRIFSQGCICLQRHRNYSCSERLNCEPFILFPYALNTTFSRMNLLSVQDNVEQFIWVFRLTLFCVDSYLEEIEEYHFKGAVLFLFPNLPQSSFGYACMTLSGKHYLHDHGLNTSRCWHLTTSQSKLRLLEVYRYQYFWL